MGGPRFSTGKRKRCFFIQCRNSVRMRLASRAGKVCPVLAGNGTIQTSPCVVPWTDLQGGTVIERDRDKCAHLLECWCREAGGGWAAMLFSLITYLNIHDVIFYFEKKCGVVI